MFDMFKNAVTLFMRGKLFQNSKKVYLQIAIGSAITLAIFLIVSSFASIVWSGAIAGFAGGMVQPRLFRDLKYA